MIICMHGVFVANASVAAASSVAGDSAHHDGAARLTPDLAPLPGQLLAAAATAAAAAAAVPQRFRLGRRRLGLGRPLPCLGRPPCLPPSASA